jgi:pyocin large subunit-like protein
MNRLQVIDWVMNQKAGSSSRKLVLLAMAHMSDANYECTPTLEYLAEVTELSTKTVCNSLPQLAGLGLITDTKKRHPRRSTMRVWRLEVPQ